MKDRVLYYSGSKYYWHIHWFSKRCGPHPKLQIRLYNKLKDTTAFQKNIGSWKKRT